MAYEHLIVEPKGAVDWVTLNRPEQLNTLNPQLLRELNDYFGGLERHYAVCAWWCSKERAALSAPAWTSRPAAQRRSAPTPMRCCAASANSAAW